MKVLLVDQFVELGGAQQCLLDLAPAIRAAGWSLAAALPGEGPYNERLRSLDVEIHPFAIGNYSNGRKGLAEQLRFAAETPLVAKALQGIVDRVQPDLVYVNGPRLLPAAAIAARSRAPLLFHCHNHVPQGAAVRAAAQALRWSRAHVVSCCLHAVKPYRSAAGPGGLEIVYNGVPAPPAGERPECDGRFTVGVVGRISPEKGQDHFLQAAAALAKPDIRFLVCGDVLFDDPAAQAYRDSLPQDSPVEFLGWRADPGPVLAVLDLLVVPSIREPATPRVIMEAYARGVAVLAYSTGGIAEIVDDGVTGVLLPEPDAAALTAAMGELVDGSRGRLRAMGENGRRLWRERFTVERYRRDMLAAMTRAVGAAARA